MLFRSDALPAFDFHCPLLSLPLAFKTTLATIPAPHAYLSSDPEREAGWRELLGPGRGPRVGLAYQIDNKTVVRMGLGVVYNSTATASGSAASSASSSALPANSGQITGLFQDGMPSSVVAVWPSFNPAVGQSPGQVVAMSQNTLLDRNAGRPARMLQWSLGLQREVNRNLVVEIGRAHV